MTELDVLVQVRDLLLWLVWLARLAFILALVYGFVWLIRSGARG